MQRYKNSAVALVVAVACLMLFFRMVPHTAMGEVQENETQKTFPYHGDVFLVCLHPESEASHMEREGCGGEENESHRSERFLPTTFDTATRMDRGLPVFLEEIGRSCTTIVLLLMMIITYIMRQDGKKRDAIFA